MKQLYLICRLNPKNKLTVIQKVTADELKQIELNLVLAKKFDKELRPLQHHTKYEEYYKKLSEFKNIFLKQVGIYCDDFEAFIQKYDETLVLPYTKILE